MALWITIDERFTPCLLLPMDYGDNHERCSS